MTVFDTARAEAIETMADAMRESHIGVSLFPDLAEAALSALLAARSSTTCETCGGRCDVCGAIDSFPWPEDKTVPMCAACFHVCAHDPCPVCKGSGTVPSTTCPVCAKDRAFVAAHGEVRNHFLACSGCDGSGTVPGGPLLLDLVAEQVGWAYPNGVVHHMDFGSAAQGGPAVPVYVARESA